MNWKRTVNDALARAGYEVRRKGSPPSRTPPRKGPRRPVAVPGGDRLVTAPTFILCTLRSGSTLLRVLLDSHSQVFSPHELHLRYVAVDLKAKWAERSMKESGLDARGLEYLLWDRVLHRELSASGKPMIVEKTPNNVFLADRLRECWPDARFIFLLRHPAAIARSRAAWKDDDPAQEDNVAMIRRYCDALESARQTYDGHTVRYEELTADPERVMRGVCDFLGLTWEPAMLEYGQFDHGRYKPGIGDWSDKIKTGAIQAPEPPPPLEEIPEGLRPMCERWGYLPTGDA